MRCKLFLKLFLALAFLLPAAARADWTFTVTNAVSAVTVPAGQSGYFTITLRENSATPSATFTAWSGTVASGSGIVEGVGQTYVLVRQNGNPFLAGQIIGYVQAGAAGPYTFAATGSYSSQTASVSAGSIVGALSPSQVVPGGITNGQFVSLVLGVLTGVAGGGSPGSPLNSLQWNSVGSLAGLTGSAVGAGGALTLTASSDSVTPLSLAAHSSTQSVPVSLFSNFGTTAASAPFEFMGVGAGDAGDTSHMLVRIAQETDAVQGLTFTSKDNAAGYFSQIGISDTTGTLAFQSNNPSDVNYVAINLHPALGTTDFYTGTGSRAFVLGANQVGQFDVAGTFACHPLAFFPTVVAGTVACISDSTTTTPQATVTGGGSNGVFAWSNGSTWRVLGNTTGANLATNLTGTPALPSGVSGTTQAAGDNTTDIATDAFVQTAAFPTIDTPPTSPNAASDEFNTAGLAGKWSVITNTANSVSVDGTIPGSLWTTFTGNQNYTISETFAPASGATDITAKVFITPATNFEGFGITVGDTALEAPTNGIGMFVAFSSGALVIADYYSSGQHNTSVTLGYIIGTYYLHLQRSAGNVWSAYYSYDGRTWTQVSANLGSGFNPTISFLNLAFDKGGATTHTQMGIDWVRVNWLGQIP